MAFDERDYLLNRRGWNPDNLTGFRRSAPQMEDEEHEYFRRQSRIYVLKLWTIGVTTGCGLLFLIFK